ncbi:hypothetical protein OWV82_020146 [Melia azedarach]|uniref:Uncharacterized protein n=1 Tax=Melia azedarach TaxID=155640 RepID=A0ACC1X5F4_MELAZ|nr:hypothetical protein OWV82_020146 [Melia azedarach]
MVIKSNVFYPRMKHWIGTDIGGIEIIAKEARRMRRGEVKLNEEIGKPRKFSSSRSKHSHYSIATTIEKPLKVDHATTSLNRPSIAIVLIRV